MRNTISFLIEKLFLKKTWIQTFKFKLFVITQPFPRLQDYSFSVHISSKIYFSCSLWFVLVTNQILYTRTNLRHYTKLSTWPLFNHFTSKSYFQLLLSHGRTMCVYSLFGLELMNVLR